MIESVGIEELKRRIRIDHPAWVDAGVHHEACRILTNFDPSLSTALETYVREGKCLEATHNGVSALAVQAFAGCGYIEALGIVNLAITDRRRAVYAAMGRRR